jgi:hypothetical protein
MTICILGTPEETAQALTDKWIEKMIKDIAQVLCNAHHLQSDYINDPDYFDDNIPLPYSLHAIKKMPLTDWTDWTRECVANYEYLAKLGYFCDYEYFFRFDKLSKFNKIIHWARDNVPDSLYGNINVDCRYCDNYDLGIFGNACDTHALGILSPFPLLMPSKYYKYKEVIVIKPKEGEQITITNEMIKEAIRNTDLKELLKIDHIKSYRNYYQATLIKTKIPPAWTRRQQPYWLNLG